MRRIYQSSPLAVAWLSAGQPRAALPPPPPLCLPGLPGPAAFPGAREARCRSCRLEGQEEKAEHRGLSAVTFPKQYQHGPAARRRACKASLPVLPAGALPAALSSLPFALTHAPRSAQRHECP